MEEQFTYEYLPWRGITKETMSAFDIKTKVNAEGVPLSIGFKYPNGNFKIREFSEKAFRTVAGQPPVGLFGRDKFDAGSHKYVTITEGELDACSLYQVLGRYPVVSVQSSSSAQRDCTVDHSWLNSFERIYIAFDGDGPGREAAGRVAKLFDFAKVFQVKFSKRKDANEYLQNGESDELKNIWWNSKRYLPDTIKSSFSDFQTILAKKMSPGVPYPFPSVTEMTYGIHTSEITLLTAQEGVGKTEVMHAIEHQLLKETKENVGAIFLETPEQRHLKALAAIELRKPAHLPDSGCTEDEILAALSKVVETDDRLHLVSNYGSGDPEHLIDTIRFLVSACGCRYVLLDHITMAVSGAQGEDERRSLDYLCTKLEQMVVELDFALIMVSHVNDMGQTRGSRYISKVAAVRIDLKRDMDSGSNIIDFFIKDKNRLAGRTGPAGSYVFDQYTRQYTLIESQQEGKDGVFESADGKVCENTS